MTNFAENFANTSDQALLHVLEFSDQYVPEALDAAIAELEKRNLTAAQTAAAREAARQYETNKQQNTLRKNQHVVRSNKSLKTFWDKISPWHPGIPAAEQKYKFVLLLWAILTANTVYIFISGLQYYSLEYLEMDAVVIFLSSAISPLICVLCLVWLYRILRKGWITLAAILYLNLVFEFLNIIQIIEMYAMGGPDFDFLELEETSATGFATQLLRAMFFLAYNVLLLVLVMNNSVREFFGIEKKHFVNSIWVALLIFGISALPVLFYIFE
ncbi:hypothetical protein [Gilvibacter sediminis]|uniref:hypothetical protein n=1 Tax=Gilvibacter sediminis TaxID=379071 RepID=UPI0023500DEA|nr:hypothetical protein [Gilvibacter sediminis]MDC7997153.1 hypothetical protein [Gilvibacter sediminis]